MHVVSKRRALSYLAIGALVSVGLLASWQWARSRYSLPSLSDGGGLVLAILLFPAFVGFSHVVRTFRFPPPRFGVGMLGIIALANLAVITFSLAARLPSLGVGLTLALVWALAVVAAILLRRAWRAGDRQHYPGAVS